MKDIQGLLKGVYYFDGGLYYQINSNSKHKLLNKKCEFKNFIVLDVTKNKIYKRDEFLVEFELTGVSKYDVLEFLDSLKFKVYRKIKLNLEK